MDFKRASMLIMMGLIVLSFPLGSIVHSQMIDAESTPAGEDGEAKFPEFFLAAVGDYPEGFFRDVVVQPGDTVELTVAVVNSGEVPVHLRVFPVNAITAINGGFYAGNEPDEPFLATSWINLDPFEAPLEPGDEHLETFSVAVPADAQPGQYMAGLVAQTADPVSIPGSDVLDQTIRYAISVSILVPGDIHTGFGLGEPQVTIRETVRRVEIPISNTGNYLVRPSGEFILEDKSGNTVHQSSIELGSIYTGTSTQIWISLPSQMPGGIYQLELTLVDPESGASIPTLEQEITVPNLADGTGISVSTVSIEPNAEPIAFANIEVQLVNGGAQIPSASLMLYVMRDDVLIDEFPLATNQIMVPGENTFTARYIPVDGWESGTYSFSIGVESSDPNTLDGTALLEEDLFVELVLP